MHNSPTPLYLIHSDFWTSLVLSVSGFNCLVILIDDYSPYVWLYPLKFKSDVYDCFVHFKILVGNLLSHKIKILQCVEGEFVSNRFKQSYPNMIFHRGYLVLLHLNKMALQSTNIVPLVMSLVVFCTPHNYLSNLGICFFHNSVYHQPSPIVLHSRNSLVSH